tara:strand:- start:226 stop:579 length:354 start_codon:yes stop_codon:yes gene_type:complete
MKLYVGFLVFVVVFGFPLTVAQHQNGQGLLRPYYTAENVAFAKEVETAKCCKGGTSSEAKTCENQCSIKKSQASSEDHGYSKGFEKDVDWDKVNSPVVSNDSVKPSKCGAPIPKIRY